MQLAGVNVRHLFVIASIGNDVLLGLDFLKNRQCVIDVTNKCLEWGSFVLPLWETAERRQCCRVMVTETIVIAPRTEMLIEGKLEGGDMVVKCGFIEPTASMAGEKSCHGSTFDCKYWCWCSALTPYEPGK